MHLKKYIQLQIFFQNVDLVKIYQENHEDKVLPARRMAELSHLDYRLCYEYLDEQLKIARQAHSEINDQSFQKMMTKVPLKDRTLNRCLLASFVLGIFASLALGLNSLLIILQFSHMLELHTLPDSWLILPDFILVVTATVFIGIGTFSHRKWATLVAGILFACATCIYLPYAIAPGLLTILTFWGYKQQYTTRRP